MSMGITTYWRLEDGPTAQPTSTVMVCLLFLHSCSHHTTQRRSPFNNPLLIRLCNYPTPTTLFSNISSGNTQGWVVCMRAQVSPTLPSNDYTLHS